jgi:hypothetical protein
MTHVPAVLPAVVATYHYDFKRELPPSLQRPCFTIKFIVDCIHPLLSLRMATHILGHVAC